MKIVNYQDVESVEVNKGVFKREVISADDGAPNFSMRVFEVSPDYEPPAPGSHWEEHEQFVLSGEGVILSIDGEKYIQKGDVIFIAPNELHGFRVIGNEPLRFICCVPLQP